ncbi:MAG: flavodoxin domain-containing protein [Pseudothermotoga sp.]
MKTLILYDTYTGTTEKCANLLAQNLNDAEVVNISKQKVPSLEAYDLVVLGTYVHAGKISKKIQDFCRKNLEILKTKKIGIFFCMLRGDQGIEEYTKANFSEDLLKAVKVKEYFGGELNYEKMNFFFRFILKQIEKKTKPQLGIKPERISSFAKRLKELNVNL